MGKAIKRERRFQPRIRIFRGKEIALGPGKADLLEQIAETGSISVAAKNLNLSYMRAWTLIQTMNDSFREPLVSSSRGGKERGGAKLTPIGQQALAIYRLMEKKSTTAAEPVWKRLQALLND